MTQLWIVGQWRGRLQMRDQVWHQIWEFQGIFDSKEAADKACVSEAYFYAPVTLNKVVTDSSEEFPGCVYPRQSGV